MELEVTPDGATATITAAQYVLRVDVPDSTATLCDREGRTWSRLSLLASLDRTDGVDESYAVEPARIETTTDRAEHVIVIEVAAASSAWREKRVRMRCFEDRVELQAEVVGSGLLAGATLLGGRAVLRTGACGPFFSSTGFASVFVPTPTEPVQVVRPASAAAVLGVIGDAAPGRLHAVFSPPPLCLGFGRAAAGSGTDIPSGEWLFASVVANIDRLTFTELRYEPVDGGFRIALDYDGHTEVDGLFTTPALVLRPAADPWQGLADYRADVVARGLAPAGPAHPPAPWWREPIFCGWGAQCARAAIGGQASAPELARQAEYDEWLAHLAEHELVPGTIVLDDRWQAAYGAVEPDPAHWPDLKAWIARRHEQGQRVLLWWKAWDADGLPAEECVLDPAGTPVAVDPGNPAYRARLTRIVNDLLGQDGLDADGFKVDFTQRGPAGRMLRRPGAEPGAPWGIAALHQLLATIVAAAKAAKPDALVVTHTPHPSFADVTDMIRLNDVLERDPSGARVPVADQLRFRRAVATAVLPEHPIDTDQWPMPDRAQWREYVTAQAGLGVPALYYAEAIDGSREPLTAEDLALVGRTWAQYRTSLV